MEDFLTKIFSNPSISWAVTLIMGVFASISIFDRFWGKRTKDLNEADDRLVKILQTTVGELEKKVGELQTGMEAATTLMNKMSEENKLLRAVLQGKDSESTEYRQKMLEVVEQTKQVLAVVISTGDNVNKCISSMNDMYRLMTEHVNRIEGVVLGSSSVVLPAPNLK